MKGTPAEVRVDFVIAGFPKTGTHALQKGLMSHPQIHFDPEVYCGGLKYC